MKLLKFFVHYPRLTVFLILLLTIFFGVQATRVTMTTDIKDFFPANHPQVETYHRIEEVFGGAEYIMVALEMEEIFSPEGLAAVQQLTASLEELPGVSSVRSLTTIDEIQSSEAGLELAPLVDQIPTSSEGFRALQEKVLTDPMYGGVIASQDGTAALHILDVDPAADAVKLAEDVANLVADWEGAGKLYLTGTPVLNSVLANAMKADLKILFPIGILIIGLILYLYFRNLRGVLLPFVTVLISLIWTLGLMGLLNKQISPLNAVMPIILVSLGNAYGIYILSRQQEEAERGHSKRESIFRALTSVGTAVLMAGVTTIAGFASNVTSEITQMRQFGIFTGIGITVALFVSLALIPALLSLMREGKSREIAVRKGWRLRRTDGNSEPVSSMGVNTTEHAEAGSILYTTSPSIDHINKNSMNHRKAGSVDYSKDSLLDYSKGSSLDQSNANFRKTVRPSVTQWLSNIILANHTKIMAITLAIIVFALAGLPRLNTDSNFFNFFAEDSAPKQAYNLVKAKFIGSESVEIIIKGDLQNPAILQAMDALQADLEVTGLVGKPFSLVNVMKRTNQVLNNNQPAFNQIPDSSDIIAQYLLLLEMNDATYLQKFTTLDYQEGRIQALVRDSSKEGTEQILQSIAMSYEKHFSNLDTQMTVTGIVVLMDTLADLLIRGQIYSLLFGLIAVFIVVRLLLKSWEGSILSVLLIAMVTLINFGLMGWLGIALDIVTVLISSIGVGVGIDYSIHIYSRFREEETRCGDVRKALALAIMTTGKPIITNAGAVISGFIILLFSSFPPLRYFGSLVTTIMLAASVGALTFVPAMVLAREKMWGKETTPKKA